ncbi:YtxH domain-containing protein [Gemmatimonas sp.]
MYHRMDSHEVEQDHMDEHDDVQDIVERGSDMTRRGEARVFGLGLLLGAALGAGAALLLAPASGEDTRRQLRRGARKLYARGTDAVSDFRDDADRMARRLAKRGMERGRNVAREVRERTRG